MQASARRGSLPSEANSVPADHDTNLTEPKINLTELYNVLTEPKIILTELYNVLSKRILVPAERWTAPPETKIVPSE